MMRFVYPFLIMFTVLSVSTQLFASRDTSHPSRQNDIPAEWKGVRVEHVFFHPVIVYPEIAFRGNGGPAYMKDWFVTLAEFKSFVQQVYERGYMLVSVHDIFEEKNGKISPKAFSLPHGKKPLIISLDDLNYYPTMQKRGVAKKLILKNGKLLSLVNSPKGEQELEDSEVTTYIDKFVKDHPDFSWRGAKGVIALTGYNGVFGYATHKTKSVSYEREKTEAVKVAHYLKSKGWLFSSHGYRHLQEPQQKREVMERDMNRWTSEVQPIIGKTDIYIFPFGNPVKEEHQNYDLYYNNGFRYFFGVNFVTRWKMQSNSVFSNRIPIDGKYAMGRVSGSRQSQFCRIQTVIDPVRTPSPKQAGNDAPNKK